MSNLWSDIPLETRLLIGARASRSLGQGALMVDFALYLKALGWTAPAIGALLTGGMLVDTGLALTMGPLSDRFGRRKFLLVYQTIQAVAAVVALVTGITGLLVVAAIGGGFGRGENGSSGPFSPIEQAWLAQPLQRKSLARIYSINMSVGFTGMGLGALIGIAPAFLKVMLPGALAYRPLFGISLIGSLVCMWLLYHTPDRLPPRTSNTADAESKETRRENALLLRLVGINILTGIGTGLIGPLMAYWLSIRFDKGPDYIAPIMALSYFITAVSSISTNRLVHRLGVVPSVVSLRSIATALLVFLPMAPNFWIASAIYVTRSALNRGTAGARQALTINLVRAHRQGMAVSLNRVAAQLPRAGGPFLAGLFFGGGLLATPFYIAAGFFSAYLYFYYKTFSRHDPNRRS